MSLVFIVFTDLKKQETDVECRTLVILFMFTKIFSCELSIFSVIPFGPLPFQTKANVINCLYKLYRKTFYAILIDKVVKAEFPSYYPISCTLYLEPESLSLDAL